MIGWIKLHRKSYDNFLYRTNKPHTRREAWEDMLVFVNFEDSFWICGNESIECKKGQSLMSLEAWGRVFNWDKSRVKRFFQLLIENEMILQENLRKTTRITICNYDTYQGDQNANETQKKRKRNAKETQTTPIKEEEEVKKGISKELLQKKKEAAIAATAQRKDLFFKSLIPFTGQYPKEMIRKFYDNWSELNPTGSKMKWEMQETWETSLRLARWSKNEKPKSGFIYKDPEAQKTVTQNFHH